MGTLYKSLIGQCAACCTCDAPVFEMATRSASKTKYGFAEFGTASTPPKRYKTATGSGNYFTSGFLCLFSNSWLTGSTTLTETVPSSYMELRATIWCDDCADPCSVNGLTVKENVTWFSTSDFLKFQYGYGGFICEDYDENDGCAANTAGLDDPTFSGKFDAYNSFPFNTVTVSSGTSASSDFTSDGGGVVSVTLSEQYDTATLKSNTTAAIGSWSSWSSGYAESVALLTCNELSYSVTEAKYRIRHPLNKRAIATGCYRIAWVERLIPGLTYASDCTTITGGGAALTSIEVVSGGTGWTSGTITISAPGNGGTTATATVTVSGGVITGIALITAGTRYTSTPTFTLSGPGTGAILIIHLGTETAKSYNWSGTVPGGYDPANNTTWPVTGEYALPVPTSNGTLSVPSSAILYYCDGCT